MQKKRIAASMNLKLSLLKEGEHWNQDLKAPVNEKMLFKNPDMEEKNTERSKAQVAQMPLTYNTKRDLNIDYLNPKEELPKYAKFVDEVPAFDMGPPSLLRPYDDAARQQTELVIRGRESFTLEEGKFDYTIGNEREKEEQEMRKKQSQKGLGGAMSDPGLTPAMRMELARQSLMETTQAL